MPPPSLPSVQSPPPRRRGPSAGDGDVSRVTSVLRDPIGSAIISVVLGLGLAVIFFRRVCRGEQCVVVKGPGREVRGNMYKLEGECYKYVPEAVDCARHGERA